MDAIHPHQRKTEPQPLQDGGTSGHRHQRLLLMEDGHDGENRAALHGGDIIPGLHGEAESGRDRGHILSERQEHR